MFVSYSAPLPLWLLLVMTGASAFSSAEALTFEASFSSEVTPFNINVSTTSIADTIDRVSRARLPQELGITPFEDGPPLHDAAIIKDYWVQTYDWSRVQASINKRLKQFTSVTPPTPDSPYQHDIPLHFIHHRSSRSDAIPLLVIHGWPGSFLEIENIIGSLTDPPSDDYPAFHVVAPSIPGFAFSPAPTHPGLGAIAAAHAFNNLMLKLGYPRYVVQAGDAGGIIMRYQAHFYPDNVVSGLSNFWVVQPNEDDLARYAAGETSSDENYIIRTLTNFLDKSWGYGQIQQTRPLKLAYAMTDSPLGLAMWIYDALYPSAWDPKIWTPEVVITWTMMHWIQGPYAAFRWYKEEAADGAFSTKAFGDLPYVKVPMAITEYPKDLWYRTPLEWAQRTGNVKKRYMHDKGGHFPAWESPELLLGDIWDWFGNEEESGTAVFRKT